MKGTLVMTIAADSMLNEFQIAYLKKGNHKKYLPDIRKLGPLGGI